MPKTKTILVTCGAGHAGLYIIEQLVRRGEDKAISLENQAGSTIEKLDYIKDFVQSHPRS